MEMNLVLSKSGFLGAGHLPLYLRLGLSKGKRRPEMLSGRLHPTPMDALKPPLACGWLFHHTCTCCLN